MKAFRLLLIIAATLGLVIAISLPDREENAPASAYRALSDHPLRQVAEAEREAGRRGSALLALDYIVDNALPDAAVAAGMRERMLGELQADSAPCPYWTRSDIRRNPPAFHSKALPAPPWPI